MGMVVMLNKLHPALQGQAMYSLLFRAGQEVQQLPTNHVTHSTTRQRPDAALPADIILQRLPQSLLLQHTTRTTDVLAVCHDYTAAVCTKDTIVWRAWGSGGMKNQRQTAKHPKKISQMKPRR